MFVYYRIVNCGGRYAMSIKFTTPSSSCNIKVIAMDGIYFTEPKTYSPVMVLPGNRADILLICTRPETFTVCQS